MLNMKNTESKMKPTSKQIGTTHCFGCKDFTHNFKPQEVNKVNK